MATQRLYIIAGSPASGKTTLAQLLAAPYLGLRRRWRTRLILQQVVTIQ